VFVSSHSTVSARKPRCASANVSPTTATPSSISTAAITPDSARAASSSTEATVGPKRGGCSTTAVTIPGRTLSIVKRVRPRIFAAASTRNSPARPMSV
jgi:hypothetical protein